MISLLTQIEEAARCARQLATEQGEREERKRLQVQRAALSRHANGTGKHCGVGLKSAVLERLPVGEENAITSGDIRALVSDIAFAPSGLSSTLTTLCDAGLIRRVGTVTRYRYYRLP